MFLDLIETNNIPLPAVFFYDRDQALIRALKTVFPSTLTILCS